MIKVSELEAKCKIVKNANWGKTCKNATQFPVGLEHYNFFCINSRYKNWKKKEKEKALSFMMSWYQNSIGYSKISNFICIVFIYLIELYLFWKVNGVGGERIMIWECKNSHRWKRHYTAVKIWLPPPDS